jgi:hypothetical protein
VKQAGFINADLEVRSHQDLSVLVQWLEKSCVVLYDGEGRRPEERFASFEVHPESAGCSECLEALCTRLEALPPEAMQVWSAAQSRVFDIGVQAGDDPNRLALMVRPDLVARIAQLQGAIALTVYPREAKDSAGPRREQAGRRG